LGKLQDSNSLFLGYTMRDWNLRVFLHRVFGHQQHDVSWAVQRRPDDLDADFWKAIGVELFALPLPEYLDELGVHLKKVALE
jgi:SIR2-like domain